MNGLVTSAMPQPTTASGTTYAILPATVARALVSHPPTGPPSQPAVERAAEVDADRDEAEAEQVEMALLEAGDHLPGVAPGLARAGGPGIPGRTGARPPGAGRAAPAATALACPRHLQPDSTRTRPTPALSRVASEGA